MTQPGAPCRAWVNSGARPSTTWQARARGSAVVAFASSVKAVMAVPWRSRNPCNSAAGNESLVDRKSTRLNSSHVKTSYAVFCLKKKNGQLTYSEALFGYTIGSPDADLSFDERDSAPFVPKDRVIDPAFTGGRHPQPQTHWDSTM